MRQTKLDWFGLRFPRELEQGDVLAALAVFSGLPHRTRVVLDLTGTPSGITHRLAVTPESAETVSAALRAAIPSLRMQAIGAPSPAPHRWLWQLSPRVAAIRTEEVPDISAALLSNLFPLNSGEAIRLTWRLRAAPRPPLPVGHYSAQDGRERVVRVTSVEVV